MPSIIVHGGAGEFRPEYHQPAREGCREAAQEGYRLLQEGAAALDAAEAAVKILEDNPVFNAGTGSAPNAEGGVDMDAILVDGTTLNFGAVGGIQNVKNPVTAARMVMERTEHCFLVGSHATAFAHGCGLSSVPDEALRGKQIDAPDHGTVGAVVFDKQGHIAAATSTGGTRGKLPGRIGDSPIIGSGALADNTVAGASATGWGESLMKIMMARTTADFILAGKSPQEAAEAAVHVLDKRVQGKGGVICIDSKGTPGAAHNTPHMAMASISFDGKLILSM